MAEPANADLDYFQLLASAGLSPGVDGIWSDPDRMVGVAEANCGLFVGWIDVGWDEPSTPFTQLRAVQHLAGPRDEQDLRVALSRARQRRKRALRTCGYRGEQLVPGHMASGSCHGCLERHEHVVF